MREEEVVQGRRSEPVGSRRSERRLAHRLGARSAFTKHPSNLSGGALLCITQWILFVSPGRCKEARETVRHRTERHYSSHGKQCLVRQAGSGEL